MSPSLIISLLAAGWLAQQPAQVQSKPISANLKVRIATSTHMPDGRVLTASASDWPLRLNEPVVAYAASGKTMCEPKVATLQQPEVPVPGWRVEITPIRESAGELEIRVQWRLLGLARKREFGRLTAGPTVTLTLHAGDRVVLDYLSGNSGLEYFVFSKEAKLGYFTQGRLTDREAAAATGCTAVGMSLEVGLEPAKTGEVVEAELWLVRPNRDGTERADRQVLRLPVGQPPSRYFFDEARLVEPSAGAGALIKVSGELMVLSVEENGRIRFRFNIIQRLGENRNIGTAMGFPDVVAAPGEVLAFKLPAANERPQLSIRLRANVLR